MERVFVDTHGWFALMDSADPDHGAAARWMENNRFPLLTTDYVFDETITLIRMELTHRAAVEFGEKLQASSWTHTIGVSPEDRRNAWNTFKKFKDQRFSFTDCTSFAVMRRLGIPTALTGDRHFQVQGFAILLGK